MPVVVTGAGGFVGRALIRALTEAGRAVVATDTHLAALPDDPLVRRVEGDLGSAGVRAAALGDGCDALVHLATVPGGAGEADPAASRRINVDAMYDLLLEAADAGACPRVVYASSIAVFGDPLPPDGVDDSTSLSPRLMYGAHKAMMEVAVAALTNRGAIDGVSLRLPGILARPKGASGMKSAFMSDLFHALREGRRFTCPVSAQATIWAQSVARCADNFVRALGCDGALMPRTRVVTLPAQRVTMAALAAEIARQCKVSADLVDYRPDPALEAAFGAHPPLATPAAERVGFRHDGDVATLVARALETIARG